VYLHGVSKSDDLSDDEQSVWSRFSPQIDHRSKNHPSKIIAESWLHVGAFSGKCHWRAKVFPGVSDKSAGQFFKVLLQTQSVFSCLRI
jgi:hypothetical protein